jgi:hypothetical protein
MRSDDAINEATVLLRGTPVFMAGSCVAAQTYDNDGWSDLDLFVPTQQVLISTIQTLLNHGYTIDDRFDRVWHRWLRYGLKGWHTNSMRLHSLNDVETNVVFKMVDGHPTTSLAQVLESFDFGLLGVGYDMESGQFRDMRPFLFPDHDVDGALPLMPGKRDNWMGGFISQYNGLREAGRYAKYHAYGYDMSLVSSDLVHGYRMAALYHSNSFDEDKQLLGEIYSVIADKIEVGAVDELAESYKSLDFKDSLDAIMEALE